MNLCGRFYVKSTFIKAAKDNWVLCDVRLLTDDVDTFLCIKSLPTQNDEDRCNEEKEPNSKVSSEKKIKMASFTALCNLSEYKSCSVKTVTVENRDSFALRLVPSGVRWNQHLLIASVDENEITTWLAICRTSIGKKMKNAQQSKDNFSTLGTLSKAGSFTSLKPSANNIDVDFDEGILDNEVYEAYSAEDKIPALVEEVGDWMKLHLAQPECYLRLTEERLELLDAITEKPVHWFPYLLIRRFGTANGILRVDAGRRCSTGDGRFFFRCSPPNGQPVDTLVTQIRQLALEAKQRLKRSQLASSNGELTGKLNGGNISHANGMQTMRLATTTDRGRMLEASTMPRSISKPAKSQCDTANGRVVNDESFFKSTAPKASPERADELDKTDSLTLSAHIGESELVVASPGKASSISNEDPYVGNLYDNVPRPTRKGSRLPGAVNVLPLPIRARSSSEASMKIKKDQFSEDGMDDIPPLLKRSSNLLTSRKINPVSGNKTIDDEVPSECAPLPPTNNKFGKLPSPRNAIVKPNARTPLDERSMSQQVRRPENSTPLSANADSTVAQTTSVTAAVMRVPPFTPPKANVLTEAARQYKTPTNVNTIEANQENSSQKDPCRFPAPLSRVLNTPASASMCLKGPHPNAKKEAQVHSTHLNIRSPGVAALVSRYGMETSSSTAMPKTESSARDSRTPTSTEDDSRNYLTELDNVIQELCKANEAAVQATCEAAKRRHQIGWPVAHKAIPPEEKLIYKTEKT